MRLKKFQEWETNITYFILVLQGQWEKNLWFQILLIPHMQE